MNNWFETRKGLLDRAWHELARGVDEAGATARLPVLATVGADGGPRARTLALRRADSGAGLVDLHTDATTPKNDELRANPLAALHLWLPDITLQIRLRGPIDVLTGADVDADWARVPTFSRGNYGVVPAPGTSIVMADAFDRHPDRTKFAVLRMRVDAIDLVHLGEPHHRRAGFTRADGFAGQWLAP